MKIGIYDPYLDDLGGGEKYMMTIAECLAKKHDVSVFWNNTQDLVTLKQRFSFDLSAVKIVPNIFMPQVSSLKKWYETSQYDAIIFLSDGSIPLVFSKKLFLHIQQPLEQSQVTSTMGKLKASRVTRVFYNSQFTKNFNTKLLSAIPSTVIYPPVTNHWKQTKKEQIILHVGRFRVKNVAYVTDYKKQSVMIDAFKQMVDNHMHHGWKFILAVSIKATDKEQFVQLQQKAKGYPIEFLINKSNRKLWDTYNKAKIYWHASGFGEDLKQHPEYAEHFGISTVEAMGAGAVPVVINAGGQKEIVTDGENGFLWETLADLQKKTERLIKDRVLLHKLSENARLRAKDFSREKFCEEVSALIMNE